MKNDQDNNFTQSQIIQKISDPQEIKKIADNISHTQLSEMESIEDDIKHSVNTFPTGDKEHSIIENGKKYIEKRKLSSI